jgi:hypothetical protein
VSVVGHGSTLGARLVAPLAVVVAIGACAGGGQSAAGGSAAAASSPSQLLERAIAGAGGAAALTRARALTWEGDAIVNAGGGVVQISGTWAIQPPDTAIVTTFDVSRGPGSVRALVYAAPRGWQVRDGEFTPMPAAMLATERDEFYLYEIMRLVPLREAGVTLTTIPADSLGHVGFRAERAGRPPVDVHVDASGRLAHLRTRVPDPAGGQPVLQDIWLSGTIESGGVRWPRDLRIMLNGEPFFALTLRSLRVHERVEDSRLRGPG